MSCAQFDVYGPTYAQPGKKRSNLGSMSSSAVSRKNKLQRCGVCGGLGHKSRTCEIGGGLKEGPHIPEISACDRPDPRKDPRTVLAAYGLLALNGQQLPSTGSMLCAPMLLMRQQTHYSEQKLVQQQAQAVLQNQSTQPPQLPLPSLKLPGASPPCSPSGRFAQPWREPLSPRVLAT